MIFSFLSDSLNYPNNFNKIHLSKSSLAHLLHFTDTTLPNITVSVKFKEKPVDEDYIEMVYAYWLNKGFIIILYINVYIRLYVCINI